MRFSRSLFVLPAAFALVAAIGCHTPQRVKYNVDGNAEAVEEPTYSGPVAHEAAPQPAPEVIKETPAPAPAPAPKAVEPAPAPKAVEQQPKAVESAPAPAPKAHKEAVKAGGELDKAGGYHVVQKGDTLQKISMKVYGTSKKWHAIMKANKMEDDKIRVGQKLALPEAK